MKTRYIFTVTLLTACLYFACKDIDVSHLKYEPINPECPVVQSIFPDGAPYDAIVTVTGDNFVPGHPEFYRVLIGGKPVQIEITEVPDTKTLKFRVPKGIGSGLISVILAGSDVCQLDNGPYFIYYYTAPNVSQVVVTDPQDNLDMPTGIAVDLQGNLYVCNKLKNVIRFVPPSGIITNIGDYGGGGCVPFLTNSQIAGLFWPIDVDVDAANNVYFSESGNRDIKKALLFGGVSPLVGDCSDIQPGFVDGDCNAARFNIPYSLVKDGNNLYVTDNNRIRIVDLTLCTVSTLPVNNNTLTEPVAIAFSRSRAGLGPLYVADRSEKIIKSVSEAGAITNLVSSGAVLNTPVAIDLDEYGNVFIADVALHQILVLYTNGVIRTLAGSTQGDLSNNLPGNAARFNAPGGLCYYKTGSAVYVSDTGNNKVKKITIE